jgi:hypothetical protein
MMRDLLPLYVNNTLDPEKRAAVEVWLADNPAAQADLALYRQLRQAGLTRPVPAAPPHLARQIAAAQTGQRLRSGRWALPRLQLTDWSIRWAQHGLGVAFSLLALIFLWILVQPGLAVEWTVDGGQSHAFRIYRAPVSGGAATLVAEIAAQPNATAYRYVDSLLLPGQEYRYWVEAVNGGQTQSAAMVANSRDLLPYQLALLLASLIIGYSLTVWLQQLTDWLARDRLAIHPS